MQSFVRLEERIPSHIYISIIIIYIFADIVYLTIMEATEEEHSNNSDSREQFRREDHVERRLH